MNRPSNTPPDGDFVRYIEQLTGSSPSVTQEDMRNTTTVRQPGAFPVNASTSAKAALVPFAGIAFLQHLRWLIAVAVALQVLTRFVPHAGWFIIPVLMGYAGWLIFRINQNLGGTLVNRFRELADKLDTASKNSQKFSIVRQSVPSALHKKTHED